MWDSGRWWGRRHGQQLAYGLGLFGVGQRSSADLEVGGDAGGANRERLVVADDDEFPVTGAIAKRGEFNRALNIHLGRGARLYPSLEAMRVASSTTWASTERRFPSSSFRSPPMVQPAGVVTSSFRAAGERPLS